MASTRALVVHWGAVSKTFTYGDDFQLYGQSNSPVALTAPVVFAGYGITAPEYHYDDFDGFDVTGKIVIVLTHEPQEHDAASPFKGKWNTFHAYNRHKIENIRKHGAAAVLIVDEWTPDRPPMTPSAPRPVGQPNYALANGFLDIPEFTITRQAADDILKPTGNSIEQLKDAIDHTGHPLRDPHVHRPRRPAGARARLAEQGARRSPCRPDAQRRRTARGQRSAAPRRGRRRDGALRPRRRQRRPHLSRRRRQRERDGRRARDRARLREPRGAAEAVGALRRVRGGGARPARRVRLRRASGRAARQDRGGPEHGHDRPRRGFADVEHAPRRQPERRQHRRHAV